MEKFITVKIPNDADELSIQTILNEQMLPEESIYTTTLNRGLFDILIFQCPDYSERDSAETGFDLDAFAQSVDDLRNPGKDVTLNCIK